MRVLTFVKEMYGFGTKSEPLNPSTFQGFSFFGRVYGGVKVTPESALGHDTVFACVRDKSESIGQLPIKLRRTRSDGKVEIVTSGLEYKKFTLKPNDYQTMQEFVEMGVASLELKGAFYCYINRNRYGNIAEILPFRYQSSVVPSYDSAGRVYYTYTTNDGRPEMVFSNRDLLVIRNFTLDGITPCSAIYHGARAIGVSIAQEEYLSKLMENGAMPQGILSTDQQFKDVKAIERIKAQWSEYSGAKGAGKTPLLENGLKYQAMSISPADSELIQQRGFSREQICGMLRVPPRRIGVSVSGSKRDVEQENKDYYQNALIPIVRKFENALNLVLPDTLSVRFDERGFLRGDFETCAKAAHEIIKSGMGSINEGREIVDLEAVEGGDVHAIDTNNLTFGLLTDIPRLQEEQRLRAEAMSSVAQSNDEEGDEDVEQ